MSDPQERPNHLIQDATTGASKLIPYSDEEWDEVKAKQVRVKAELEAQATAELAAKAKAESDKTVIDARPTDDGIKNAKTIAELKDLMLRQNASLNVVLKKLEYIV